MIPNSVRTRDQNGDEAINVTVGGGSISGTLTVAAIGDNAEISIVDIDSVNGWVEVENNLTKQLSVAIQNQSETVKLYFRYANPMGDPSTGWNIYPLGHKIMMIKPEIPFYLKAESGTVQICIDRIGE